ncbi:sigma-70 family RNA polymerase sigma factor [Ruminococcus sp.]|uniref:sigma-70 family RNA polymerase sigma factor n=1 Tax=Ruminococcus sp. TaxID=41978 RepID=UPI0025D340E3|nr:sigma-70 family RNA polymerase sigma factor [Ruminococcus sp.]MBQ9541949.1 sigma-70 family RNA polymerase sigma factor [Ruminococcus sp.]
MTNEQLCIYIQQDSPELLPVLWDRVKHLCFLICGRYYSQHTGRFNACGIELCDYQQECYHSFLQAVKSFNPDKGVQFTSFLDYPIRNKGAELLGIRNPSGLNHEPLSNAVSLDTPTENADNEGLCLGDTLPDEHSAEPFESVLDGIADDYTKRVLSGCINKLTDTQQKVIIMYYFQCMTQKAIGAALGVSGERIRQIRQRALRELRNMPALCILRREQKEERQFHNKQSFTHDWYHIQQRISIILKHGGEYLSYGQKQAIIFDCKVRQAAESNPEYKIYKSLAKGGIYYE